MSCDSINASIPDSISESSGDSKLGKTHKSKVFDMENPVVYRRPLRKGDDSASNIFGGPVDSCSRAKVNPRITKSQIFNDDATNNAYEMKRKSHAPTNLSSTEINCTNGYHHDGDMNIEAQNHRNTPDQNEEIKCASMEQDETDGLTEADNKENINETVPDFGSEIGGQGDMPPPHEGLDAMQTKPLYVTRGGTDSQENYKKNQRGMYNPITGESYD